MARYFMNFIAKTILKDGEGYEFNSRETAIAYARAAANDLARTDFLLGCAILVTDEVDDTVIEIPVNRLDS